MDRTNLVKHALLILAGVIVALWTIYLMVNPLKYALSLVLFAITFIVGELLLSENQNQANTANSVKVSKSSHRILADLSVAILLALSLAIIRLIPSITGELFIEWHALEFLSITRLIAAFGLNFLPGYLILTILGSKGFSRLPRLITSYFLSLFVLTITGFVSALLAGIINELFLDALSVVNTTIIVIYILKCVLRWRSKPENPRVVASSPRTFASLLPTLTVGLAIAFMGVWLLVLYSGIGFFIGGSGTDMWRTHGITQTFIDYKAFVWLHIPWWFNLYLGCFIFVSGVPSVNAYFALYPLIALSTLSFHVMASSLLKERRMASLATLAYTIFSGPAWLYALYLRGFGSDVNYDAWIRIISMTGDKFLFQGFYPPFMVGFTGTVIAYAALWWLIYAVCQLDLRRKINFFLASIVVALSYLLHGVEPVIFVILLSAFLFVFLLTQNFERKKQVGLAALSIIVALALVSVIDLSLTRQYDDFLKFSSSFASTFITETRRYYYFASPSFYLLAVSSVIIFLMSNLNVIQRKSIDLCSWASQKLGSKYAASLRRRSAEIMFYAYGVALIVWVVLFPSLSASTSAGLGWVPWFVYPVVGGVPFLLALVGVAIVVLKWRSTERSVRDIVVFCTLSLILLFFFGQLISFINESFFYTSFWERRTLSYMHPLISMLMAYALVTLIDRVRFEKTGLKRIAKIAVASLLTLIVLVSSVSSTLLAGDYAARIYFRASLTNEELEALNFLHYSLPQGSKTAYLNLNTGTYIRSFAGDKWTFDPSVWIGQFYYSPSSVISSIRQEDIKFLYLNRIRDARDLEKNLFIKQLIKVLPIEFNNSEVTIYSIPLLRAPSQLSSLRVVSPTEKEGLTYDAYVLWSLLFTMSKYPYAVMTNSSDLDVLNATQTIIMPYDPLPVQGSPLLEWVSQGGQAIVSNTNQYGMFADLLGLASKVSLVNCDSTENWTPLFRRGDLLLEPTVKAEGAASLRLRNNQSSWEQWLYTPPTPWNLSSYEYLGIWVYGSGGGPRWLLYLTDSNNSENYFRYDVSTFDSESGTYYPSFTGWKLHLIPIRNHYGNLNLSSIRQLRIVAGPLLPLNMLIDEIFMLGKEDDGSLPISANGISGEVSIGLPNIEIRSLTANGDVGLLANYTNNGLPVTPFALEKSVGNGKVTYLNVDLLFQFILSEREEVASPYEILSKILEIIGFK